MCLSARAGSGWHRSCSIAPPGELDLTARIAGLRLVEHYGWSDRRPFDGDCVSHISVYGR